MSIARRVSPGNNAIEGDSEPANTLPAYGELQELFTSYAQDQNAGRDGRIDIDLDEKNGRFSKLLRHPVGSQLRDRTDDPPTYTEHDVKRGGLAPPALNIVIHLVGSRGDVQPFIPIGRLLQRRGHRVRVATHSVFKSFIQDAGLEFFDIGGDPADLMSYMVRNPGLLPSFDTVVKGEVQQKRNVMYEIMQGCWRSCVEAGDGTGHDVEDNPNQGLRDPKPFVADVIVANPPSFAHIHCAERLGVPLHIMFTMPWSPTQAFAHPLVNIRSTDADPRLSNYLSYILVEGLTWQGIGKVTNAFRRKALALQPLDPTRVLGMMTRLKIPHTYLWSPSLISRPRDWKAHITVAGFSHLKSHSQYTPPRELAAFLESGPAPVYIGFGSIVVSNPRALTETIVEAVNLAGIRAVLSQGWGDLGGLTHIPSNVLLINECPHDWLFEHVACLVHHGGAGTTAAGVAAGKPSVIVPFFGDQFFWGMAAARAGAGLDPIPVTLLSADKLAAAIKIALGPEMSAGAAALSRLIREEDGAEAAVESLYRHLPIESMRCSMAAGRAAAWRHRKSGLKLSAFAAAVLKKEGAIHSEDLEISRSCIYNLGHGPWEPISGGGIAVTNLFYETFKGIGEIGTDVVQLSQKAESSFMAATRGPPTEALASQNPAVNRESNHKLEPSSENERKDTNIGMGTLKGITRILKASARAPGNFAAGMGQGAHNAPRLWGDKTVRLQEPVTGIVSGILAGGKGLFLETYDGIAGLFVQPYIGLRDEGLIGGLKGFARGIVGTPTKFFAAMCAPVGYPLQGVDVEIQKLVAGRRKAGPVETARRLQGEREYLESSQEERKEVIGRWALQGALKTPRIAACQA